MLPLVQTKKWSGQSASAVPEVAVAGEAREAAEADGDLVNWLGNDCADRYAKAAAASVAGLEPPQAAPARERGDELTTCV